MGVTVAFSGSTEVDSAKEVRVRALVRKIVADRYVTGGAPGIDTIVAQELFATYPAADHIIVVPSAPHNYPAVKALLDQGVRAIYMPDAASHAAAYRARNTKMVELVDGADSGSLIAFPKGAEAAYRRSGTWMTCRIARKQGVLVTVRRLDQQCW